MDHLGEDLLLLCIGANGKIINHDRLKFGLMGAELVRLAASARIDIQNDRIIVKNGASTGDPQLDAALASIGHQRRPPKARNWVATPRQLIVDAYAQRLAAQRIVVIEPGGFLRAMRCILINPAAAQAAHLHLHRIAQAAGPVTTDDAAFGGLAHATGIVGVIYPGFSRRHLRRRFQEIAKGQWTARAVTQAAVSASTDAAIRATTDAAVQASIEAASRAAIQAATDAAVQASVAAAVDATAHAASSHDSGGGGGHSHGH